MCEFRQIIYVVYVCLMMYRAFSAIVADQQFANLGLMLLGTLARIRRIIEPYKKEVEPDLEKREHATASMELSNEDDVDYGEVVAREVVESIKPSAKRGIEDDSQDDSELGRKKKTLKGKKKKISVKSGVKNG
jgi:ribonuclease MRP protein subunit RMP1